MEKGTNGPARDRTSETSNNKVAVHEFKPYAQSQLPDNRLFKKDLLAAAIKVRQAQLAFNDALFVFETHLEAALDSDEMERC